MIDHDSIPFIEETIQVWSAHRPGLGEEHTVSEDKGFSTSFSATPRTRRQLAVITAYHRHPSKSKMLAQLIEQEYAFALGALNMARKIEEELEDKSLLEEIKNPSIFHEAGEAEVPNEQNAEG
jgi:hypothetical protein